MMNEMRNIIEQYVVEIQNVYGNHLRQIIPFYSNIYREGVIGSEKEELHFIFNNKTETENNFNNNHKYCYNKRRTA